MWYMLGCWASCKPKSWLRNKGNWTKTHMNIIGRPFRGRKTYLTGSNGLSRALLCHGSSLPVICETCVDRYHTCGRAWAATGPHQATSHGMRGKRTMWWAFWTGSPSSIALLQSVWVRHSGLLSSHVTCSHFLYAEIPGGPKPQTGAWFTEHIVSLFFYRKSLREFYP